MLTVVFQVHVQAFVGEWAAVLCCAFIPPTSESYVQKNLAVTRYHCEDK